MVELLRTLGEHRQTSGEHHPVRVQPLAIVDVQVEAMVRSFQTSDVAPIQVGRDQLLKPHPVVDEALQRDGSLD